MYFEIYQENKPKLGVAATALSGNQWRWRLCGGNHEPIASGESYHNKQDCVHAINLIKGTNSLTPINHV